MPSGTERIFCHYFDAMPEQLYLSSLITEQEDYGHHTVLYRNLGAPRPAGTVEDCTETSGELLLIATPSTREGNRAWVDMPEGLGLEIPEGAQLVVQNHYVNTSTETIRPRDTMELKLLEPEDVKETVYVHAGSPVSFGLPPRTDTTFGFECELDIDMTIVSIFPHMHEAGARFRTDMGPRDSLTNVIDVQKWDPEMRSVPPITNFEVGDPVASFQRGDVMRTFCTISNNTEETRGYPEEMCATVAFFYSSDPAADHSFCVDGADISDQAEQ